MAGLFGLGGGSKAVTTKNIGTVKKVAAKPSKFGKAAVKSKPAPKRKSGGGGGGGKFGVFTPSKGDVGGIVRGKGGLYVPSTKSALFAQPKGDALWYPFATRPSWLDGKLPGDVGFDPLELSKPKEFLSVGQDQQDLLARVNKAGKVIGKYKAPKTKATTNTGASTSSLNPYTNVFGVDRLRECELIHGRWAMLALVGIVVAENQTQVSWVDAGAVEIDQAQYANFNIPLGIGLLTAIEVLLVGGVEVLRNGETDNMETRLYPGGNFDPLNLGSDPSTLFNLKTAEIKHSRLAMVGMLVLFVKALATGNGAFMNPN